MIVRKTFDALKDALEPARDQMIWKAPEIEIVETGHYKVSGSRGFYKVTCGRLRNHSFFVECLCKANQVGRPCYHALRAMLAHITLKEFELAERKLTENK